MTNTRPRLRSLIVIAFVSMIFAAYETQTSFAQNGDGRPPFDLSGKWVLDSAPRTKPW